MRSSTARPRFSTTPLRFLLRRKGGEALSKTRRRRIFSDAFNDLRVHRLHGRGRPLFQKAGVSDDLDEGVFALKSRKRYRRLSQSLRQAAPLGSRREGRPAPGVLRAREPILTASPRECRRMFEPFLLKAAPPRPNPALTAGARLLMSAAMEGEGRFPLNHFGKAPRKSHRRRKGALAAVRLF